MASDSSRELFLQITASVRHYAESLRESGGLGLPQAPPRGQEEIEQSRQDLAEPPARFPDALPPRAPAPSAPQPPPTPAPRGSAMQAEDLFLSPQIQTVQTLPELRT